MPINNVRIHGAILNPTRMKDRIILIISKGFSNPTVKLFMIIGICIINKSYGQPPLKYVQYFQDIQNTNAVDQYNHVTGLADSGHGVFFTPSGPFTNSIVGGKVYDSINGKCGFIMRYNYKGTLKWYLPVYGTRGCTNPDKLQGANAVFLYDGSIKIGNDSTTASYTLLSIDTNGNVVYMVPFPITSNFKVLRQTLAVSKKNTVTVVVSFDVAKMFKGKQFDKGLWCVEFDAAGNLVSYVRLGSSASSDSIIGCVVSDSAIYFNGSATKSYPFIGNDFSVRAIDSTTHPGGYSADQFLACVDKSGKLKWLKRVDTMGMPNQVNTLAQTSNGNIFWVVNYDKSGVAFGKKLQVNFRGYGYSYLAVLNPAGDLIKEYYVDTVGGGNDNVLRVQSSSNFDEVLVRTAGTDEGYRKWKNLPDSAKSIYETTTLIIFDSLGRFSEFWGIPYYLDNFFINTYRKGYGLVVSQFRKFQTDYNVNGVTITNKGGNDYAFWYITAFKPNTTQTRNNSVLRPFVFPNPARDEFRILGLPNLLNMDLMIYNALGIEIKELHRKSGNDESFEISDLPDGMYFIQMKVGGVWVGQSIKLMVQH